MNTKFAAKVAFILLLANLFACTGGGQSDGIDPRSLFLYATYLDPNAISSGEWDPATDIGRSGDTLETLQFDAHAKKVSDNPPIYDAYIGDIKAMANQRVEAWHQSGKLPVGSKLWIHGHGSSVEYFLNVDFFSIIGSDGKVDKDALNLALDTINAKINELGDPHNADQADRGIMYLHIVVQQP